MSDTPETMLATVENTIQAALDTAHHAADAVVDAAQAMMPHDAETADQDHADKVQADQDLANHDRADEMHANVGSTDQPEA